MTSIFYNRLQKNFKKLSKWASQNKLDAFRVYEKDIPEFPYIVDRYGEFFVVYEKGKKLSDDQIEIRSEKISQVSADLKSLFNIPDENIIFKMRVKNKGEAQYEKESNTRNFITINEGELKFKCNLHDYIDTGLFLDHRPLRQTVRKISSTKEGQPKQVLNLFCYTGSISVYAAAGGGKVTSVDLSNTYIKWTKDNFLLNNITLEDHTFIAQDCLYYLHNCQDKFDLIVLDPPTFSTSKKMDWTLDINRDHMELVELCMKLLKPEGKLYFSNNSRKFKMDDTILTNYFVQDISEKTIPMDFRDKKIHQCFLITFKK